MAKNFLDADCYNLRILLRSAISNGSSWQNTSQTCNLAIWQSEKNTQDMDGGIRRRGVNGYNWNSFFPHPSSSHKDGQGIRWKIKIWHKTERSWVEFVIKDVLIWHFRRNFCIDNFQFIFLILRKRKWTEPKRILSILKYSWWKWSNISWRK